MSFDSGEWIAALITLPMLGFLIVYLSGSFPAKWQTPGNAALVGYVGVPLFFGAIALAIQFPFTIVILLIIFAAASSK